jgi:hypothetical protein
VAKNDLGDKATALKQLVELHESGALSDDEFAEMRDELLNGKAASRRNRILIAVGLVIVALGAVGVLVVTAGGTSGDDSAAETISPATAVPASIPPATASPTTMAPTTVRSVEDNRQRIISNVSGLLNIFPETVDRSIASWESRLGFTWAPNGLSSAVVAECAIERFAEFSDHERLIGLAIDEEQRFNPTLHSTSVGDIVVRLPETLQRLLDDQVSLARPFVNECAGFPF